MALFHELSGRVAEEIRRYRLTFSSEADLQDQLASVFDAAGISYEREATIAGGRIDFLCGHLGVEVKIAGSPDEVWRQLERYAAAPEIDELVLVTTRPSHRWRTGEVGDVPLRVVKVSAL